MSFGFVCQIRRVQRSLGKDCHVASSWPLLPLWQSKNRSDILSGALSTQAKSWWWYSPFCTFSVIVSSTTLLIYQEGMPSLPQSLIFSTDSNFPFSILEKSLPPPFLSSSLFLCFFASPLESHFLKGKPSPKQEWYVLLVQRVVVLLKARGLSPDSDGQLPG